MDSGVRQTNELGFFNIDEMFDNMESMELFYDTHANTKFEWDMVIDPYPYGNSGSYSGLSTGYFSEDSTSAEYPGCEFDEDTGLMTIEACLFCFESFEFAGNFFDKAVYKKGISQDIKYSVEEALSFAGLYVSEKHNAI